MSRGGGRGEWQRRCPQMQLDTNCGSSKPNSGRRVRLQPPQDRMERKRARAVFLLEKASPFPYPHHGRPGRGNWKVFLKKTAEPTEKKFADLLLSPTFTPQSPREPGTQWKKEVALGAHKIGSPVPTGFSHHSDSAPQLSWAGHREDSHHPSRYGHFPWLKWGCSTVIPEAQIMHVRENKNSGTPSTKKQKKVLYLSTCCIVESKEYLHKKRDHYLKCADRDTIYQITQTIKLTWEHRKKKKKSFQNPNANS